LFIQKLSLRTPEPNVRQSSNLFAELSLRLSKIAVFSFLNAKVHNHCELYVRKNKKTTFFYNFSKGLFISYEFELFLSLETSPRGWVWGVYVE